MQSKPTRTSILRLSELKRHSHLGLGLGQEHTTIPLHAHTCVRLTLETVIMHLPSGSLLLSLAALASTADAARKPSNAILLSNVKSLTLRKDAMTSSRRVSPIPQLKCIGGGGCKHYNIDVMRCKNAGTDYGTEDIQWTCTANIPEEFKLGSTDVICEGYDGPDDPYVLKGSCGVEYRLLLTDKGEERYGSPGWGDWDGEKPNAAQGLFWMIFLGVLGWIVWGVYKSWRDAPAPVPGAPRRPFWGGGWGGGGGGGGDDPLDPPPPYPGYPSTKPTSGQQGWTPGFWSGALGGAAAGYMANRGNRQQERRGLFGGGGYGNSYGSGYGSGSPWSSSSPGPSRSGSGSSSGARYESTGFGSTSRR